MHSDGAFRLGVAVTLTTNEENQWAAQINYGGQHVREPEADVLFAVCHADRTNQGADVDEEVNWRSVLANVQHNVPRK